MILDCFVAEVDLSGYLPVGLPFCNQFNNIPFLLGQLGQNVFFIAPFYTFQNVGNGGWFQ